MLLLRLASRSMVGPGRTGSSMTNGGGAYAIAFSTANRVNANDRPRSVEVLANDAMSPLLQAVIEATEEAIINSLLKAATTTGNGRTINAADSDKAKEILFKYGRKYREPVAVRLPVDQ